METIYETIKGGQVIPTQIFNGKKYRLYKGERYFSKSNKRLHREVWKYHKGDIPNGYDIHHVDGNTFNNKIENLNLVKRELHLRFSSKKRFIDNPEFAKEFQRKGSEASKSWHSTNEGIEFHRKIAKLSYAKRVPETRQCEICGKSYETKAIRPTKYCHPNCNAKAVRLRKKLRG